MNHVLFSVFCSWNLLTNGKYKIHGEREQIDAEPKTGIEALLCHEKEEWKKVMEEKIEFVKVNHVCDLVDLPSDRKIIRNK